MASYIQSIRAKIGHDKFICPAVRILIENDKGEFLFVERRDNGKLGLPAGAIEEGETIEACVRREVKEETGLDLGELIVIGISSDPVVEKVRYPNGDIIQYFVIEFYSKDWDGELKVEDEEEIKRAIFLNKSNLEKLPESERGILKRWEYYQKHHIIGLA